MRNAALVNAPGIFRFLGVACPLMVTCLVACTRPIVGREFSRPDYATYSKGTLTESDIIARYGSPYSRNKFTNHDATIGTLNYVYVVRELGGDYELHRKKTCSFYFSDAHYLGYAFGTGFQNEQAPVPEQNLSRLVKGQTSKTDALAMFGAPTSALRYPATPEGKSAEGDSTVGYEYHRYSGQGMPESAQFLTLTFDASNVLKRIDFDSREQNPHPTPSSANSSERQEPMHWGAAEPQRR